MTKCHQFGVLYLNFWKYTPNNTKVLYQIFFIYSVSWSRRSCTVSFWWIKQDQTWGEKRKPYPVLHIQYFNRFIRNILVLIHLITLSSCSWSIRNWSDVTWYDVALTLLALMKLYECDYRYEWSVERKTHENCWSIRNHRTARNKRTTRKIDARNETQTSESQEKSRPRLVRRNSMDRINPDCK